MPPGNDEAGDLRPVEATATPRPHDRDAGVVKPDFHEQGQLDRVREGGDAEHRQHGQTAVGEPGTEPDGVGDTEDSKIDNYRQLMLSLQWI
jgi:hypothetical protein